MNATGPRDAGLLLWWTLGKRNQREGGGGNGARLIPSVPLSKRKCSRTPFPPGPAKRRDMRAFKKVNLTPLSLTFNPRCFNPLKSWKKSTLTPVFPQQHTTPPIHSGDPDGCTGGCCAALVSDVAQTKKEKGNQNGVREHFPPRPNRLSATQTEMFSDPFLLAEGRTFISSLFKPRMNIPYRSRYRSARYSFTRGRPR